MWRRSEVGALTPASCTCGLMCVGRNAVHPAGVVALAKGSRRRAQRRIEIGAKRPRSRRCAYLCGAAHGERRRA